MNSLASVLREADIAPIRYPAALWTLIHNSPLPDRCTWGDLCTGINLDRLQ